MDADDGILDAEKRAPEARSDGAAAGNIYRSALPGRARR